MNANYLPPVPVPGAALRIARIETCRPKDLFPGLVLCRVHTDQGLIGCGESYYIPEAVQAVIHDWFCHRVGGYIDLPTRPGLGVRLNESLFDPGRDWYRGSAL